MIASLSSEESASEHEILSSVVWVSFNTEQAVRVQPSRLVLIKQPVPYGVVSFSDALDIVLRSRASPFRQCQAEAPNSHCSRATVSEQDSITALERVVDRNDR